ncbi:hypothetical protein TSOC_012097, partial [Tetrabaena socialis]
LRQARSQSKQLHSTRNLYSTCAAAYGSAYGRVYDVQHQRLQCIGGDEAVVWTSLSRPGTAVGLINCSLVGHGHVQLFRCACQPGAPAECFEQHDLVAKLAAEGRMPFTGGAAAGGAGGRR